MDTSAFIFDSIFFILAGIELGLYQIPPLIMGLAVLEHLKNRQYNIVATLARSFLIGSSQFLQVTRTTIKSRQSSNFGQIR